MQLSQIKISNLFHFPYVADFAKAEGIQFSNPDKNNVNVLIGPNGAGKSSFLNVINRVWKIGIVKDCIFDKSILLNKTTKRLKDVITLNTLYVPKSHKHYDFPDKESRVWIEFVLTNHDYENIWFLFKNREKLNALISKYSNFSFQFPLINLNDIRHIQDKVAFEFVWNVDKKTITVAETWLDRIQQFVLDYFRNIELVQICIDIYNEFERPTSERRWYPLKNSFAILGVNRSLEWIPNVVDPNIRYSYISDKTSDTYESFVWGFLCIRKIRDILNNSSEENASDAWTIDFSSKTIEKKLKKSDFYKSLIFALNKYLDKNLVIEYTNGKLVFWLVNDKLQRFAFDDLSDGEQSLLIIIFTIYGYDLKYGTFIIDEPEVYFHPQMQRSFVRMVEKISSNIGTQFLISTYSPLFVDDVNIGNVYRFSKVAGNTKVQHPTLDFASNESTLIHLLKFENMSKIFFVNKIIMVEGETDQYFFEYYLKYMHTFPERKDKLTDYEIININGKWAYKTRRTFLSKFGISSYFIGDRDNIVDFGILTQNDLSYYYKQSKKFMYSMKNKQQKNHDPYYSRLVQTLKSLYLPKYYFVIKKIKELYKDNIFILERWDIETYLGMKEKWLEETVVFCHQYFQERLRNKKFDDHRRNFRNILEGIFK